MIGATTTAAPATAAPTQAAPLTVASYNLYLGSDLIPLFYALTEAQLRERAAEVYAHVQQTDFPSRADAVAAQIAENPPELIGLQEVSKWETGPIGGSYTTRYDYLQLILDALSARGLAYEAVASNDNFSDELEMSDTDQVRFTDRDVILARTGAPIQLSNPQSHRFLTRLPLPHPAGHLFIVPRGWSAVDVTTGGTTVRFVDTHLESIESHACALQAGELSASLSQSPYPVIVVGDLNSEPTDSNGAYGVLANAGYQDSWIATHGPAGGFTSGQSELLDNVPSTLDKRIDFVLYESDAGQATSVDVMGDQLGDRTPAGLWPSDHAGVRTELSLGG